MGRGNPFGKRAPMAERYVTGLQRMNTRPYPECERQRGSVRSAAAAVHQAMKLLPGPGKPETKNIIAHSDQTLWTQSRHHHPTSHFDALRAKWSCSELGIEWWGSWRAFLLDGQVAGTSSLLYLGSLALTIPLRTCPCSFNKAKGEAKGQSWSSVMIINTSNLTAAKGNSTSCLFCTGFWGSRRWGSTFLPQAPPWERNEYLSALWFLKKQSNHLPLFSALLFQCSNLSKPKTLHMSDSMCF